MTFAEWVETVPREIREEPLWRMEVYRLSLFAADLAWPDVTRSVTNIPMPPQAASPAGGVTQHATRTTSPLSPTTP